MVYGPARDSYFLRSHLEQLDLEGKKVLDMGTGSGILAVTAAKEGAEVVACDIDQEALEETRKRAEEESPEGTVKTRRSDLFENIDGKFDFIVFNPPYLPGRKGERTWRGGEKGIELTEEFLRKSGDHLKEQGKAVFIASSASEIGRLEESFDLEEVDSEEMWFETLYIYETRLL